MKNIIGIFMLAIFIVSAFPVSAANGNAEWGTNNIDKQKVAKYNQIKEKYSTAAREWNSMSDDFKDVKDKIKKFGDLNPNDQEQVLERTRAFLSKTLERMEIHLEIMESWTERIDITEERKEIILENIENMRLELESYQSQAETSDSLEEMRDLAKEIRESWRNFLPMSKHISGELLTAKIGNIIADSENLSDSLQEKLNALDQSAEEVIKMQQLLEEFNSNIELAKEQYELAQDAYSQIDDMSDADQLFQETKDFVFAARDYLQEAHESLRELVREYRDFTGESPSDDDSDDEIEDNVGVDKYPEIEDATEE